MRLQALFLTKFQVRLERIILSAAGESGIIGDILDARHGSAWQTRIRAC